MNKKIAACVAAIALALCGGASAQNRASGDGQDVDMPRYCGRQHGGFERYYPARALERGQEGAVTLDCVVANDVLSTCRVAEETNPNWGFGDSALAIACRFSIERNDDGTLRLSHAPRDSRLSTDADGRTHARIPVRFRLNTAPPPPPPPQ